MSQIVSEAMPGNNVASIYVGELSQETSEQTLFGIFLSYGQVLSVKVCRDSTTQSSLGYAYVNYRTKAEAECAIKSVNFSMIDGKQCRVMWSMRDAARRKLGVGNLFVKNLDITLDSKALYEAFSVFGPVMSAKVATTNYGASRGYGFVQFYSEKDAEEAMTKTNGVEFMEKKLSVVRFVAKNSRIGASGQKEENYTNVFVKNFGQDWDKEKLKEQFSKFGEITSLIVRNDSTGKSRGFGFVNFVTPACACEAVKEMHNYVLPNKQKLYVGRAMKKLEREAYLKQQHELRKKELAKQFHDMNLYIKNFDESYTEDRMKEDFSRFGKIKSCKMMKDENGKSRGFGFVSYSSAEEAKNALDAMNKKMCDSKPLFVTYAQTKDERRKTTESRVYNDFRNPMSMQPNAFPLVYNFQPFPYPPQVARYPPVGPMTRQVPPNQGRGPHIAQQVYPQGQNMPFLMPQAPYPQNYQFRSKSNVPSQSSRGGMYNSSVPRHQSAYNSRQTQLQSVVSSVVTERRPERPVQSVKTDSKVVEFRKDRVYQLCKSTFQKNSLDSTNLDRITAAVIDSYKNSFNEGFDGIKDDEISAVILKAYQSFTAKSEDGGDSSPKA